MSVVRLAASDEQKLSSREGDVDCDADLSYNGGGPVKGPRFPYGWYRSNGTMPNQANLAQLTQILHEQLPLLVEQYRVESLGVFGSYVRDEQSPSSDLDLLVTFHETPSLLQFIELENYLSDLLGVKVDLVMKDALKPRIGERILNEVVTV
jgi:predicted nucleotidyltransferase